MILAFLAASAAFSANLVTVNGKPVTDSDLTQAIQSFGEGQRQSILKDSNARSQVLSSLVDQELLLQEAEKAKLEQTQEYKQALTQFRKQFLSNYLVEKKLGPKLTEAEAKKYYNKNRTRFTTDQVRAFHILLSTNDQAKKVLQEAKAKDADFQALAEKYSIDPTAKNNRGDIGFIGSDRLDPAFVDAAFRASVNEIVGPVRTAFGFHIIKVIEKKPGHPLNYEEVELSVKSKLRQELTREYLDDLRDSAKIQYTKQN